MDDAPDLLYRVVNVSALGDPHVRQVWSTFALASGSETMLDAYGWEQVPDGARHREEVFAFYDLAGSLTAWTSLAPYPKEPTVAEVAVGVMPAFRRRGVRGRVLAWTADAAFGLDQRPPCGPGLRLLGVDQVWMAVLDSCTGHAAQCVREAEAGSSWVYAGRMWYPDPYRLFVLTKDAWLAGSRA